jgi:NAD(P)-dependent dehydrogenase (short-subunit alcohol dehydrogenase family)
MAIRRAVVTGGGRGIGRAVAAALSGAGHRVTVFGRNEAILKDAVRSGVAGDYRVVDVTDAAALVAALAEVGAVDILVNNAGIAESEPFVKTDAEHFQKVMAVNFDSVVTATRAVLPGMIERKFGRVISVASIAGLKGVRYASAYAASKHAVVGLTRSIALEVARHGVTVNAVCPAYVDTDIVAEGVRRVVARTGRTEEEAMAVFVKDNPQGRLITVDEVADAVLWLASDGASAVNGQAIAVSGGEG